MKGKILDFSIQNGVGVISADDGKRYNFSASEWKSDKSPTANQIVDFEIADENAVGIYLDSSSNIAEEKLAEIKNSDIFKNGVQNKTGFIISILLALSLFLKAINAGFFGSASFMDGIEGKLLFILILGVAFLYYSGIQQKVLKILSIIITIGIFIKFFVVFANLSQGSGLFGLLSIGTYVTIPLTVAFIMIALKSKFKEA